MAWMGFPEAIRISVGSPAENTRLIGAITHALAQPREALTPVSDAETFSNRPV